LGNQKELVRAVSHDFRDELGRIISGGTLAKHMDVLLQSAPGGKVSHLLQYGMERLPADGSRPDDALAAFFVVLSEFKACPREIRIFATKCMEYCESEALDGWSDSLAELRKSYEELPWRAGLLRR
jgi:hypothetical protein